MIEVGDVTNCESQYLNLGQLLVWWERWEQFSQFCKGHVEGYYTDPLPGGVRGSILRRGAPPAPLLLPAEDGNVRGARLALSMYELSRHGPRLHIHSVQKGLRARLPPGQIVLGLLRTEHHAPVCTLQIGQVSQSTTIYYDNYPPQVHQVLKLKKLNTVFKHRGFVLPPCGDCYAATGAVPGAENTNRTPPQVQTTNI